MAAGPTSSPPPNPDAEPAEPDQATAPAGLPTGEPARAPRLTRTGAAWVATATALVLLILLIVFVLQNLTSVEVSYFGFTGSIPLGMALLVAAVVGGVVVAIAGVARVTQLRVGARRARISNRQA